MAIDVSYHTHFLVFQSIKSNSVHGEQDDAAVFDAEANDTIAKTLSSIRTCNASLIRSVERRHRVNNTSSTTTLTNGGGGRVQSWRQRVNTRGSLRAEWLAAAAATHQKPHQTKKPSQYRKCHRILTGATPIDEWVSMMDGERLIGLPNSQSIYIWNMNQSSGNNNSISKGGSSRNRYTPSYELHRDYESALCFMIPIIVIILIE
jgi:hypothetical protein